MQTDEEIEAHYKSILIHSDISLSPEGLLALEKLKLQALAANKLDRLVCKHLGPTGGHHGH